MSEFSWDVKYAGVQTLVVKITDKMKARASLEVIGNNVGILNQGLIRLMGTSD
ncbi:hypothetical protein ACJW31_12G112800 [Castanea mollissima]